MWFHIFRPSVRNAITHAETSWRFRRSAAVSRGVLWGTERQGTTKRCGVTHVLSPVAVHMGKLQPGDREPTSPEVGGEPRSGQIRYLEVSPPASLPQVQNDDSGTWSAVSWVIFIFHG